MLHIFYQNVLDSSKNNYYDQIIFTIILSYCKFEEKVSPHIHCKWTDESKGGSGGEEG